MSVSRGGRMLRLLLSMLAVAIALPAVAPAAKGKRPAIPNCAHFSVAAMARIVASGPLTLEGDTNDGCLWVGLIANHYRPSLSIHIEAVSKAIFLRSEHAAKIESAHDGSLFGNTISSVFKLPAGAFDETHRVEPAALPPCDGGQMQVFGPPLCSGEPAWTSVSVDAWGPINHRGPSLEVSVGESAQSGDVYLLHVLLLAKAIFAGQIH
jgi:hypothetical protein